MTRSNVVAITADLQLRRQHVGLPHASDPDFILGVIKSELDRFDLYNLESNDHCLTIKATSGAMRMYDLQATHIGYSKYSFESWTSEPVLMEVHVDETCIISVLTGVGWIAFSQWLQQTGDSEVDQWSKDCTTRQRTLLDKQWRLWQENGKKFELMQLPAEIREVIYEQFFGEPRYPERYRYARLGKTDRWSQERVMIEQPGTAVLRLNRQIYLEASHSLFEYTMFRITSGADLHRLLVKNRRLALRIRRLELALDLGELFGLFRLMSEHSQRVSDSAQLFRRMKLKELILEVGAPEAIGDVAVVGITTWHLLQRPICHQKYIDIVLKAAQPWLAGNDVAISGFVKLKQKLELEAKFAEKRKEYVEWCAIMPIGHEAWAIADYEEWKCEEDGGVRLDGREASMLEKVTQFSKDTFSKNGLAWHEDDEFPPLCHCATSCALETWDAEA